MAQRRCGGAQLSLALIAALLSAASAQTVLRDPDLGVNETAPALSVPDKWVPCGRTLQCPNAKDCCAIWGVCGNTDRFCGQYCLNGACLSGAPAKQPPPPQQQVLPQKPPAPPPPAAPVDDEPPAIDQTEWEDEVLEVRENEVALAGCTDPGWVITSVDNVLYGDVATRCNSTEAYRIVSAACTWQSACIVPAVNAVFGDPCPGAYKTLAFGYRCQPTLEAT